MRAMDMSFSPDLNGEGFRDDDDDTLDFIQQRFRVYAFEQNMRTVIST